MWLALHCSEKCILLLLLGPISKRRPTPISILHFFLSKMDSCKVQIKGKMDNDKQTGRQQEWMCIQHLN